MIIRALSAAFLVLAAPSAFAQANSTSWPNQRGDDFIIKDFRFKSGETIAELKQHYTTLGTPKRNAAGDITNAVILLHGTSSSGTAWLMPSLGRRAVRRRPAARRLAIFHHPARRHRPRRFEQAERRPARQVSPLSL